MPPMAILAGGSLLSGAASAYGANKAAKSQVTAANQANATQQAQYEQSRQDQMPWMKAGEGALNAYTQMLGLKKTTGGFRGLANGGEPTYEYDPSGAGQSMMEMDPGYQFRMGEGQRALDNSAAARGGALSGNAIKAATRYGQDYGSNEYANILNRFSSLAGVGQTQANQMGSLGANMASQVGQNQIGAGNARASGYANKANAFGNMMQSGASLYGNRNAISAGWGGG